MEPFETHRLSLNLYQFKEITHQPPKTWPIRLGEQHTIIDDTIWPAAQTKQVEVPFTPPTSLKRVTSRSYSFDHLVEYFGVVPEKSNRQGVDKMIPELTFKQEHSLEHSSPEKIRKDRHNLKIRVSAEGSEGEVTPKNSLEDKVDQVFQENSEQNSTPPQVRRTLSNNFFRGPKIHRTSSAPLLTVSPTVHALRETSETQFPISKLIPADIFGTVTRNTKWNSLVQPAFDEIVIKRKIDKQNMSVTTLSAKIDEADKIVEKTENYYIRLVKEIYKQQGQSKVHTPEIQEQLRRMREYKPPMVSTGSRRGASGMTVDYETMQNDLGDIHCLEILRRLSTRGFAPATYAAGVLWPQLFPDPTDIMKLDDEVRSVGKKKFYMKGGQIFTSGAIHLKRHRCSVIQRKLYEFNAMLLSREKIPKSERKVNKYRLALKAVPIGSLVLRIKSRNRPENDQYYDFTLRMEDVTPLKLSDLREIDSDITFTRDEISRAERIQQVWLRETMEFKCEQQWKKNGLMLSTGFMLYPGQRYAPERSPKSSV